MTGLQYCNSTWYFKLKLIWKHWYQLITDVLMSSVRTHLHLVFTCRDIFISDEGNINVKVSLPPGNTRHHGYSPSNLDHASVITSTVEHANVHACTNETHIILLAAQKQDGMRRLEETSSSFTFFKQSETRSTCPLTGFLRSQHFHKSNQFNRKINM